MSQVMAASRALETAAGLETVDTDALETALGQLMDDCLASCDALQARLLASTDAGAAGG